MQNEISKELEDRMVSESGCIEEIKDEKQDSLQKKLKRALGKKVDKDAKSTIH